MIALAVDCVAFGFFYRRETLEKVHDLFVLDRREFVVELPDGPKFRG